MARLWSLYCVACGQADRSLHVLYIGRVTGLGEGLLMTAGETTRWRLRVGDDVSVEDALALLLAAHPGGSVAFPTAVDLAGLLAQ